MTNQERGARLESFINAKLMNKSEFARALKLTSGMVSFFCNGSHAFTGRLINSIAELYPELNLDWLFHGRGTMISADDPQTGTGIPVQIIEMEIAAIKKELHRVSLIVDKKKRP
jgi:hypothetical protein